jgi:hypothetical protein
MKALVTFDGVFFFTPRGPTRVEDVAKFSKTLLDAGKLTWFVHGRKFGDWRDGFGYNSEYYVTFLRELQI